MKTNVAIICALVGGACATTIQREPLLSKEYNPLLVHQKPAYDGMNIDYFVPDFGVDQDIKNARSAIAQTEKKLKKKFTANFKADKGVENPRDYFVPDFGRDFDI